MIRDFKPESERRRYERHLLINASTMAIGIVERLLDDAIDRDFHGQRDVIGQSGALQHDRCAGAPLMHADRAGHRLRECERVQLG